MDKQNNQELSDQPQIEDLTLKETETANVKGGARFVGDSFGFGVEREMKESGEKGGTA